MTKISIYLQFDFIRLIFLSKNLSQFHIPKSRDQQLKRSRNGNATTRFPEKLDTGKERDTRNKLHIHKKFVF